MCGRLTVFTTRGVKNEAAECQCHELKDTFQGKVYVGAEILQNYIPKTICLESLPVLSKAYTSNLEDHHDRHTKMYLEFVDPYSFIYNRSLHLDNTQKRFS